MSTLERNFVLGSGRALQINLYWQPIMHMAADYAIFLHLIDAQDKIVTRRDTIMREYDYPTSRWQAGELVVDMEDLPIPSELSSGEYQLDMGVYDMKTMQRLSLPGSLDSAMTLMTIVIMK